MTQPTPQTPGTGPVVPVDGALGQPSVSPPIDDSRSRRFLFRGSLRERAARGTIVNTAFLAGLSTLGLVKGFVLAGFLSQADYGLWGVLIVSLSTFVWMKQAGIGDKYLQQDDEDQEAAFQKAFTLELAFTGGLVVLMAAVLPLVALAYGLPEVIVPGLITVGGVLASAFQAPIWVFYRRMQFVRQRMLQAVDPVVAFVVSIGLAAAGAGYWAFVVGFVAGVWASAAAAILCSPLKLRLRFDRGTLRSYVNFSWPLFVAGGSSLVMTQSAVITAEAHLGLAAVGVIALAATIANFTDRISNLVTGTLYPAICAVKDRTEILYESFVKSNRLALMWAVPFGIGLTLFSSDLVSFGIGERWRPAVEILQIYGVLAAVNQVGFNWSAYFRARGETRPIAVANVAAMVAFLLTGLPLLLLYGLRGFAVGIGVQGLVALGVRAFYVQRLFHGFGFLSHMLRAFLPSLPAVVVVLLLRAVESGERTLPLALGELVVYMLATAAATWYFESRLLREAMSYLARRAAPARA